MSVRIACWKIIVTTGIYLFAAFILGFLIFALWFGSELYTVFKYDTMRDTGDLRAIIDRQVVTYTSTRPNSVLVVAVHQAGRRYVKGCGLVNPEKFITADSTTLFEIGSITKVFTATLLAFLDDDNMVDPKDLLVDVLDSRVAISAPIRGVPISLLQLATHTSGLARLPEGFEERIENQTNPYATYDVTRLLADFASAKVKRNSEYEYSNFGYALLGYALEAKCCLSYGEMVERNILSQLLMRNTTLRPTNRQKEKLAQGYDCSGQIVPYWDFNAFTPAGGYYSNTDDLMSFLEANLADDNSRITNILKRTQKPVSDCRTLAWTTRRGVKGQRIFIHNGGTGGFSSFFGFDKKNRLAVVVLANYGRGSWKDLFFGDPIDRMGINILKMAARVSLH